MRKIIIYNVDMLTEEEETTIKKVLKDLKISFVEEMELEDSSLGDKKQFLKDAGLK